MTRSKDLGFILLVGLWTVFTLLCYYGVIVFDNTTLSGAMLSSLILSTSMLSIVRLLKMVYEVTYSALKKEND